MLHFLPEISFKNCLKDPQNNVKILYLVEFSKFINSILFQS